MYHLRHCFHPHLVTELLPPRPDPAPCLHHKRGNGEVKNRLLPDSECRVTNSSRAGGLLDGGLLRPIHKLLCGPHKTDPHDDVQESVDVPARGVLRKSESQNSWRFWNLVPSHSNKPGRDGASTTGKCYRDV